MRPVYPKNVLQLLIFVFIGLALGLTIGYVAGAGSLSAQTPITSAGKQPRYISVSTSNPSQTVAATLDSNKTTSTAQTLDPHPENDDATIPGAWLGEIQLSLEPFEANKISRTLVSQPCLRLKSFQDGFRLLIIDNQLYVHKTCGLNVSSDLQTGQIHGQLQSILQVLCLYQLPNMELVISWSDKPRLCKRNCDVLPLFSWSKTANHRDILMPFHPALNAMPWKEDIEKANKSLLTDKRWEQKKPVAMFRGATTGGIYRLDNWKSIVRSRLVEKCNQRRDLCDAAIVRCGGQCTADVAKIMEKEGIMNTSAYLSPSQAEAYKYLLLINGNGAPSSRSATIFHQDSLVMFQEETEYEFFYSSLRPYVHYLPVGIDFEDLYERILWAKSHDALAKEIVRNALTFARQYLTRDAFLLYFKTVLEEYAKLLSFEPTVTEDYVDGRVWLNEAAEKNFVKRMGRWNSSGQPRCKYWTNTRPSQDVPV